MEIFQSFRIEASHSLPNMPDEHPCKRLHGHSYRVEIHVSGPVDAESGWVMDFAELEQAFRPLMKKLDHAHLNEIEGLQNPTCENLAQWIWQRLRPSLPGLSRIVINETETSGCTYSGEGDPE
jgi:6-pyruvoyltetrahydropterin/6-carboxytetrahydropterin synthase